MCANKIDTKKNNHKDKLKAFDYFKTSKKLYEIMFFDVLKRVYSCVFSTLYIEIRRKC